MNDHAEPNGIPKGTNPATERHVLQVLKAISPRNIDTLADVAFSGLSGEPLDDKTMLMERVIQLTAELPLNERPSDTLTNKFLSQLWNDLEHPPKSFLGFDYAFRKADGSNNNVLWPHIGKAGEPYARTVSARKMQPTSRPDPGVVFDAVLARKKFSPHPNGISSVLFYLASIIIHDCFRTSRTNFAVSETSSYLDLAPLYGSNEEEQMSVRTRKDGRLKADSFAEKRVLGFPPGVSVLLVLFNRFHNDIVQNLAKIDEGGRFSSILRGQSGFKGVKREGQQAPTPQELYDEALFQTGRLITTGLYVNIVLKDYVRTILNLNRVDSLWNLDPRSDEGKAFFGDKIPEAQGNQCAAEFNLVYRWHSCVSKRDAEWTEAALKAIGEGKVPEGREFVEALERWDRRIPEDPAQRTFDGLKRNADGKFSDDDLSRIWVESVEDVAGSFGAAHVPPILRSVEILGMMQARSWNLGSLNEFRQYFKLQPHPNFESINPDPHIARQLEKLYGHVDNVEIYPGIVVEAAKQPMKPGSGLCASFTTSRAILSDAVALVRSDRFHTIDYTPLNLTNYGFKACSYDLDINHGCVFYKLLLNALPNHFPKNSVYAHYPLVVPAENRGILRDMGREKLYSFDKPTAKAIPMVGPSTKLATAALEEPANFQGKWAQRAVLFNGPTTKGPETSWATAMLQHPLYLAKTAGYYEQKLQMLWKDKQYELGGAQQIDVVQDLLNPAHIGYLTTILGIPAQPPQDKHLHRSLSGLLGEVFDHAFGSAKADSVSKRVRRGMGWLTDAIDEQVSKAGTKASEHECFGKAGFAALSKECGSTDAVTWTEVLPTSSLIFHTLSRLSVQTTEYLLDNKEVLDQIRAAATSANPNVSFQRLAKEATRQSANISLAKTATTDVNVKEGLLSSTTTIPGQTIVVNLGQVQNAGLKDPTAFRTDRDDSVYSMAAYGPEIDFAYQTAYMANTVLVEILARQKDLKRAPGPQGKLKKILDEAGNIKYLNAEESEFVSYPQALKVRWAA